MPRWYIPACVAYDWIAARKDAGESTTLDVQQRNQELQEARTRLLRNQLDYRIAERNLDYVQGVLTPPERGR